MLRRSMFVTFEGGEGAGKTTLITQLHKRLTLQGHEVVATREPGGSPLGDSIRQWLLNHDSNIAIGKKAELLLFLAARAQHIEQVIRPALAAGKIVLCDRFNDSTIAYQGVARGLGLETVQTMCNLVCEGLVPDLTFFVDVDPIEGLRRTQRTCKENAKEGEVDRIEAEASEFHQRVREGLQVLAQRNPERICTLNGNRPIPEVFAAAMERFEQKFEPRLEPEKN